MNDVDVINETQKFVDSRCVRPSVPDRSGCLERLPEMGAVLVGRGVLALPYMFNWKDVLRQKRG